MLASRDLPPAYAKWNRQHRAPHGRPLTPITYRLRFQKPSRASVKHRGAFAWQPNNTTRAFEYPWAIEQIGRLGRGLTIADIGGGLAGMQFALARDGYEVLNVDPGMQATGVGFDLDPRTHARLSAWLDAPVTLIAEPLQTAGLAPGSVDVVLAVSTIEHFSPADLAGFASSLRPVLAPGGHVVLTIDLFLDLSPFTSKPKNVYGTNIDVAALIRDCGLRLVVGQPQRLNGFREFDPDEVLRALPDLLVGEGWPTLTQLVVARPV